MCWFRKRKKEAPSPRPKYSVTFWDRSVSPQGNVIFTKQVEAIPRAGEKVMLGSIFDHPSPSKFLEVVNIYHIIGDKDNNIIIVLDEPP